MKKKHLALLAIVLVVVMVSGCVPNNENLVGPDTGGIWQAIIKFSSYTVIWFGHMFGNNLVWGVVGLAIAFNIVLLPFTIQQQSFSKKIAEIQPKIEKINHKYAKYSDKDQVAQQQKSMEIMALYQKHKINPMMGCLPMFIQMPLLIAVYGGVTNLILFTQTMPGGEVVHGLDLFNATDLSSMLFGLDFVQKASQHPVLLFLPVISGLLSFISVKIANIGVDTSANPSMKMMMFISPLFSVFIGFSLPAVISVYWIVSTVFRTVVTLWFKRKTIKQIRDKKRIQKEHEAHKKPTKATK